MDITKLKLSELLRLAVRDAQAAEAAGHELNMGTWLETDDNGRCLVCMAGAVMLQTLGLSKPLPGGYDLPHRHGEENALLAIDNMRTGDFVIAYDGRQCDMTDEQDEALDLAQGLVLEDYDDVKDRASWETYLKAADVLEAGGL